MSYSESYSQSGRSYSGSGASSGGYSHSKSSYSADYSSYGYSYSEGVNVNGHAEAAYGTALMPGTQMPTTAPLTNIPTVTGIPDSLLVPGTDYLNGAPKKRGKCLCFFLIILGVVLLLGAAFGAYVLVERPFANTDAPVVPADVSALQVFALGVGATEAVVTVFDFDTANVTVTVTSGDGFSKAWSYPDYSVPSAGILLGGLPSGAALDITVSAYLPQGGAEHWELPLTLPQSGATALADGYNIISLPHNVTFPTATYSSSDGYYYLANDVYERTDTARIAVTDATTGEVSLEFLARPLRRPTDGYRDILVGFDAGLRPQLYSVEEEVDLDGLVRVAPISAALLFTSISLSMVSGLDGDSLPDSQALSSFSDSLLLTGANSETLSLELTSECELSAATAFNPQTAFADSGLIWSNDPAESSLGLGLGVAFGDGTQAYGRVYASSAFSCRHRFSLETGEADGTIPLTFGDWTSRSIMCDWKDAEDEVEPVYPAGLGFHVSGVPFAVLLSMEMRVGVEGDWENDGEAMALSASMTSAPAGQFLIIRGSDDGSLATGDDEEFSAVNPSDGVSLYSTTTSASLDLEDQTPLYMSLRVLAEVRNVFNLVGLANVTIESGSSYSLLAKGSALEFDADTPDALRDIAPSRRFSPGTSVSVTDNGMSLKVQTEYLSASATPPTDQSVPLGTLASASSETLLLLSGGEDLEFYNECSAAAPLLSEITFRAEDCVCSSVRSSSTQLRVFDSGGSELTSSCVSSGDNGQFTFSPPGAGDFYALAQVPIEVCTAFDSASLHSTQMFYKAISCGTSECLYYKTRTACVSPCVWHSNTASCYDPDSLVSGVVTSVPFGDATTASYPLPAVHVDVYSSEGDVLSEQTNNGGKYSIGPLEQDAFLLSVVHTFHEPVQTLFSSTGESEFSLSVDLERCEAVTLSGRVAGSCAACGSDASTHFIPNANVSIYVVYPFDALPQTPQEFADAETVYLVSTIAGSLGYFEVSLTLEELFAATNSTLGSEIVNSLESLFFLATSADHTPVFGAIPSVSCASAHMVPTLPYCEAGIEVSVETSGGQTLEGVMVTVSPIFEAGTNLDFCKTDGTGVCPFTGIEPGKYIVRAVHWLAKEVPPTEVTIRNCETQELTVEVSVCESVLFPVFSAPDFVSVEDTSSEASVSLSSRGFNSSYLWLEYVPAEVTALYFPGSVDVQFTSDTHESSTVSIPGSRLVANCISPAEISVEPDRKDCGLTVLINEIISDATEEGSGVTVSLYNGTACDGSAIETATTNENGLVTFENIQTGVYTIWYDLYIEQEPLTKQVVHTCADGARAEADTYRCGEFVVSGSLQDSFGNAPEAASVLLKTNNSMLHTYSTTTSSTGEFSVTYPLSSSGFEDIPSLTFSQIDFFLEFELTEYDTTTSSALVFSECALVGSADGPESTLFTIDNCHVTLSTSVLDKSGEALGDVNVTVSYQGSGYSDLAPKTCTDSACEFSPVYTTDIYVEATRYDHQANSTTLHLACTDSGTTIAVPFELTPCGSFSMSGIVATVDGSDKVTALNSANLILFYGSNVLDTGSSLSDGSFSFSIPFDSFPGGAFADGVDLQFSHTDLGSTVSLHVPGSRFAPGQCGLGAPLQATLVTEGSCALVLKTKIVNENGDALPGVALSAVNFAETDSYEAATDEDGLADISVSPAHSFFTISAARWDREPLKFEQNATCLQSYKTVSLDTICEALAIGGSVALPDGADGFELAVELTASCSLGTTDCEALVLQIDAQSTTVASDGSYVLSVPVPSAATSPALDLVQFTLAFSGAGFDGFEVLLDKNDFAAGACAAEAPAQSAALCQDSATVQVLRAGTAVGLEGWDAALYTGADKGTLVATVAGISVGGEDVSGLSAGSYYVELTPPNWYDAPVAAATMNLECPGASNTWQFEAARLTEVAFFVAVLDAATGAAAPDCAAKLYYGSELVATESCGAGGMAEVSFDISALSDGALDALELELVVSATNFSEVSTPLTDFSSADGNGKMDTVSVELPRCSSELTLSLLAEASPCVSVALRATPVTLFPDLSGASSVVAVTDSEGAATFSLLPGVGTFDVQVSGDNTFEWFMPHLADGHSLGTVSVASCGAVVSDSFELELCQVLEVGGYTVGANGEPVAGAAVELVDRETVLASGTSAGDGSFLLLLDVSSYTDAALTALSLSAIATHPRYYTATASLSFMEFMDGNCAGAQNLTFATAKPSALSVAVTTDAFSDLEDAAVAGAAVALVYESETLVRGVTNALGAATLPVPAGRDVSELTLEVRKAVYVTHSAAFGGSVGDALALEAVALVRCGALVVRGIAEGWEAGERVVLEYLAEFAVVRTVSAAVSGQSFEIYDDIADLPDAFFDEATPRVRWERADGYSVFAVLAMDDLKHAAADGGVVCAWSSVNL
eukprot:gnl/Chilomastix_cuspidata/803.p1 GENE.gnl/Chilomastix_cuspidata/803~~gnl/Chilomastix_cuspidata/803.p1  ORF type:complete len:2411 (-),score=602.17 gnl/Chilomastix_cuspidata/803:36-7268(-)